MSRKVSADKFAEAIMDMMEEYKQDVTDGLKKDIRKTTRECRDEIKANSPVLTGDYKNGWATQTSYESSDDLRMTVYNKTDYQLTHLLENGHAIATGGRVEGIPHIGPAEEHAAEKLENRVKVTVRKG